MTYECFDVEVKDRIAHIVLSRPAKRNSMTPAFWRELPQIVRDIDAAAEARVIVISSTGPHFTAGLDISHLREGWRRGQPPGRGGAGAGGGSPRRPLLRQHAAHARQLFGA